MSKPVRQKKDDGAKKAHWEEPKERVYINPEVCEGCGDCSEESNCLSVIPLDTELGRKRQIDQSACNKDYSCLRGFCPSFVTVTGTELRKSKVNLDAAGLGNLPIPPLASIDEQPWNVVVTGVGGTGVLTIASVLAMAAHLEGKGCATMNQTGLAQKFGAVVSHVRIGKKQESIKAVRIAAGDADLLLGCDLIVAAGDEAIAKLHKYRSHAIVNDFSAASGDMIVNPDAELPSDAMKQLIKTEAIAEKTEFIAATQLATQLLGDSIASNMFLLGFAQQKGLLPVSIEALKGAIELNGVAVEFNLDAYEWGRHAALDIDAVKQAAGLKPNFKPLNNLDEIIADRHQRLIDYQSKTYADEFGDFILKLREREANMNCGKDFELTKAVARSLYKLMAYKDEYEVARLFSNGNFANDLARKYDGNFKLNFYLAPPLFSPKDKRGNPRKLKFPGFTLYLFKLLAKLRFVRGSYFDLFGFSGERREERQAIHEFQSLVLQLFDELDADNYAVAVELAQLPQQVRGYGHVKAKKLAQARIRQEYLLKKFRGETVSLVSVVDQAA